MSRYGREEMPSIDQSLIALITAASYHKSGSNTRGLYLDEVVAIIEKYTNSPVCIDSPEQCIQTDNNAESSNGRKADFESVNAGSNPASASSTLNQYPGYDALSEREKAIYMTAYERGIKDTGSKDSEILRSEILDNQLAEEIEYYLTGFEEIPKHLASVTSRDIIKIICDRFLKREIVVDIEAADDAIYEADDCIVPSHRRIAAKACAKVWRLQIKEIEGGK